MKKALTLFKNSFAQPYFCALFFIAILPLVPEYIAFVCIIPAALFAYKDLKQNPRPLRFGAIGKLLSLFCAYQTLSTLISSHPLHTLFVSLMWWFFLIGYVVLVNMINSKRKMRIFLFMITVAAGVVGAIAFIQYQINQMTNSNTDSVWRWLDKIIYPLIDFGIVELPYGVRAYSTFSNPNIMAKYLVMVAPFAASYNFMEHRKPFKIIGRLCLVFIFAGVIYSFSRGGYLAMILLGIALVIIHFRKKFLSILLYTATTLLLLPTAVLDRLSAINQVGERQLIWQHSIARILESPFFGYGAGTQPTYEFLHQLNIRAAHAHNVVLQVLLEGGIIALILLGALGFKVIKDGVVLMLNKNEESFWIGFAICGFAVMFVTHGMVDYPFSTPKLVVHFITTLALVRQGYHLFPHKKRKQSIVNSK